MIGEGTPLGCAYGLLRSLRNRRELAKGLGADDMLLLPTERFVTPVHGVIIARCLAGYILVGPSGVSIVVSHSKPI